MCGRNVCYNSTSSKMQKHSTHRQDICSTQKTWRAWCVGWLASAIGQVTVPSVAIGNPERHVRKASHRGSKQQ